MLGGKVGALEQVQGFPNQISLVLCHPNDDSEKQIARRGWYNETLPERFLSRFFGLNTILVKHIEVLSRLSSPCANLRAPEKIV